MSPYHSPVTARDQGRFRELDAVLASLGELLNRLELADKADWIEARRAVLGDPAQSAMAKDAAVREVRGIISGMGSLLDLRVVDDGLSRERDDLADRLYALTRSAVETNG